MNPANEIFKRCRMNPILTFADIPYQCEAVFNPGAIMVGDETLLLLRVEDTQGVSHLMVARSADGISNWRIEKEPLISPSQNAGPYEEFGCEDPRITYIEELGLWIIAYTAYSGFGAGIALATTKDFRSAVRFGLVLAPNNKDAAVFPRKVRGNYWMLHRPVAGTLEHIWLTQSTDLVHWGRPWCVLMERGGPMWDGAKVGTNTVPVETSEGWLLLYHGVKEFAAGPTYRMGAALLDIDDPRRMIARLPFWVLGPREQYETSGAVPNVVFACGHTLVGDQLRVYYGAADTCVCMAEASITDLLGILKEHKV